MSERVFVIAEAGVNHNGSLDLALQLVDVAARAGADAVKFQTFRAESLASTRARKADYQTRAIGGDDGQLEMLRALELDRDAHATIAQRCRERGIAFMSTAFDLESLHFLAGFDMPAVKIASGDLTASPFLLAAARLGKPLIVSTGMSTLDEIGIALGVIAYGLTASEAPAGEAAFRDAFRSEAGRRALVERVSLLHCVTEYPAPLAEVNLRAMNVLRERFGVAVGYSDHTLGTSAALAAAALGATVIEKHFTLDTTLPGPDHRASLEPDALAGLVRQIREIEIALGREQKAPTVSELRNRVAARRSLVAALPIACGEVFTEQNLALKRPGDGLSPLAYWDVLGKKAVRDFAADDPIET